MSRPPVLTSLYCKLVRDQLLILCGNTSRGYKFSRLQALCAKGRRTSQAGTKAPDEYLFGRGLIRG